MTTHEDAQAAEQAGGTSRSGRDSRRRSIIGAVAVGVGAICLFVATRLTWVTAVAYDDRMGESTYDVVGARWVPELAAVAAVLAVGFLVCLVVRRLWRRVVAAVCVVLGAVAGLSPIIFVSNGADPARVRALLTANADSPDAAEDTMSSAAQLTAVTDHRAGAVLTIVGCLLAIFGAVLVLVAPGADAPKRASSGRYSRKAERHASLERNLTESPDSTRVMWDALDADIDPTDGPISGATQLR